MMLSIPGHWRGCHGIAKAASDIPSPVPSAQKKNAVLVHSCLQSRRGAFFFSTLLGPVLHLHSTPPLHPPMPTFHSCTIHPWSNLFWGMGVRISESLFVFILRVRGSHCLILSVVFVWAGCLRVDRGPSHFPNLHVSFASPKHLTPHPPLVPTSLHVHLDEKLSC